VKKILVIGASGFVGNYLFSQLKVNKKYITSGTRYKSLNKNLIAIDYKNLTNFSSILSRTNPDIIIWTAGIKDIKLLEENFSIAERNNIKPIEIIVEFQQKSIKKIQFIFISSDYVFNGDKGNYNEKDYANPDTNYGKSKLIAEKIIQEKSELYSIIRVGAILGKGSQFWDWLIYELTNSKVINLYDEIFSPTPIETLFLAVQRCIEMSLNGIFHISGDKKISRYELGLETKSLLSNCKTLVRKVKKNPQKAIDRSLKRSSEFNDFKNLEIKELL
tara:strand:- start:6194 stop:7018 length:825 start_codon:yes stop_codon:yes gene_type:complete